ncbi:MAG: hypothetical protein KDD44_15345, partial [Bdellovibrionales bacterium]|nr:hypothetical protein [Bdellovibrionales bacterium]
MSWRSAFNELPKDSNGWSVFLPSADSRLIYVSSSTGNDATGQVYSLASSAVGNNPRIPRNSIAAYRTIDAAMMQVRTGAPDWILLRQ